MTTLPSLPDDLQGLTDVATFTQAVARVQQNRSLTARQKGKIIAEAYTESLRRLEVHGELTPSVESEFRSFAEVSLQALAAASGDYGRSLNVLVRHYGNHDDDALPAGDPNYTDHAPLTRRERLANWWSDPRF